MRIRGWEFVTTVVPGRGLWTTAGTRANFHGEGGKEAYPKVFKVQMRPSPLAH